MRALALFIISFTLLLASCKGNKKVEEQEPVIPENVLNESTMVSLIVDLNLFEAARGLNLYSYKDTARNASISPDAVRYQEILLKKYGTHKNQFDSSFSFYAQHPKVMFRIYEQALNQLSEIQSRVNQ